MATSVGTLWVDVRFNTGNIARDLGTNLRGVSNQIGTELGGAGAAAGEQITAGLSQKLTTLGTSMGNLGRQVSLGLSLPLIAFGAAATSSFTEFDTAMTQVIGLSGVAATTVEGWRGEVIDLGKAYGVSAAEAAEGLYFITSSGIDAADAMNVLQIAVKGSAIGLGSVKTNADVITSALNQYGEENITAAQAADVLTAAVRTGKGEADAMSGALATVIPLAGAMGVSFGEVAGVMSAMTLSGTSADQAATQINALFTSLQKMPVAAQRNMKALTGLDYATVQQDLKTKGLTETLRTIYNAFGDNEDAIAKVFGNVRALRGITNLFGEKEAQTMDVVNQTTHAFGAQDKAVQALEGSEAYRLKQAQANMSAAMTTIGASVTPIAALGTQVFAGILNSFDLLPGAAKTAGTGLLAVAAASGPLLYMGSSVMRLAGNVGTLIGKTGGLKMFDGVLLKMMYSSNSLASGFANAVTGATSLGASMRFLGVSVLAVAAAYVLLNNKLHENDAAFAALAEKGKQNQAGKSYDELGAQIQSVNAQIDAMNQQKADILAGGIGKGVLFGARELHDLDEAQKALYGVGEAAAKNAGPSGGTGRAVRNLDRRRGHVAEHAEVTEQALRRRRGRRQGLRRGREGWNASHEGRADGDGGGEELARRHHRCEQGNLRCVLRRHQRAEAIPGRAGSHHRGAEEGHRRAAGAYRCRQGHRRREPQGGRGRPQGHRLGAEGHRRPPSRRRCAEGSQRCARRPIRRREARRPFGKARRARSTEGHARGIRPART